MRTYKGERIAVLGLSIEGIDTVDFLLSRGAQVTCCDRRTKDKLGEVYKELSKLDVSFQLGDDYLNNLEAFSAVVRTPGMSPRLPELMEYVRAGREITSLTKLFFAQCRGQIIGVTGTKGKGTTSTLIAHMLESDGKKVYLGGNVGTALLSKVDSIQPDDWVVLELSSFQLEDLTQSPHISVVLRTTQEHLANFDTLATNFHPTREEYIEAKKSIVRYQSGRDIVIVNGDDPTARSFVKETKARAFYFSQSDTTAEAYVAHHVVFVQDPEGVQRICDLGTVKIRGDHNLENIAAASLAARAAGCSYHAIISGASGFEGLEHRLEVVGTRKGVTYVNDSFSTVPETTIAAIESYDEPLILIVGGSEKGSDFTRMGEVIAGARIKALIVIGAMTERILTSVSTAGYKGKRISGLGSMHDVVSRASQEAHEGDVVLLSPACASFDMFHNYKERGKLFKEEVKKL